MWWNIFDNYTVKCFKSNLCLKRIGCWYPPVYYINVREYRRGNQKWTIQRNRPHRRRQIKQKHNTICVGQHYAQTNTNNVKTICNFNMYYHVVIQLWWFINRNLHLFKCDGIRAGMLSGQTIWCQEWHVHLVTVWWHYSILPGVLFK